MADTPAEPKTLRHVSIGIFPAARQDREPLMTLADLAREIGSTLGVLKANARKRPLPDPVFKRSTQAGMYRQSQLRAWWKQIQAEDTP